MLRVDRFMPHARTTFVTAILCLGVVHVLWGEAVGRWLPVWPEGLPGRPLWAHLFGVAVAALAGAALIRARPRTTLVWLGALMLLPVVALSLPRALAEGGLASTWLNVIKFLALASGPVLVAARVPGSEGHSKRDRLVATVAALSPWLMAAFMIDAAYAHLRYPVFVSRLVPAYLPWPVFWTLFAGVALAAGGVGLVLRRTARLAALMTSLMIFLWLVMLHTPRMLADPSAPGGWSEMAEALAFSMLAFLLAEPPRVADVEARPRSREAEEPAPA